MAATVLQGNVFDVLPTLKPGSVDAIVTSPPYWALRSYLPQSHELKSLELGSERTPDCGMSHRAGMVVMRDDLTEEERLKVVAELLIIGVIR